MPCYLYRCVEGHQFDRYLPVERYREPQTCHCGAESNKIITAPMIFVQPDCHYTSPIDGREITSRQQRIDDLARHNCMEYDPEMKKDAQRRSAEADAAIEKSFDETIEREIHTMPVRKREALISELDSGVTVEPVRK